jgi:hypothetical protein
VEAVRGMVRFERGMFPYVSWVSNLCFTGVILNPFRKPIPNVVVRGLYGEMVLNPDGFYVYSTDPEVYLRTLNAIEFRDMFDRIIAQKPFAIHFHFRLASSGAIDVGNVHGWKLGDYLITHNGVVRSYAGRRDLCDTLILVNQREFQELLADKRWSELYDYIAGKGFYGVMFIVNKDFSEIYAISTMKNIEYSQANEITYATSGDFLKGKGLRRIKLENYVNGIFQITHEKVRTLVQE